MSSPTNPLAAMNEEEAPSEQKKTFSLVPSPVTNLFLPDDILLSSLSRISRLYYPTFSLVSKSFRSLVASPELYLTRSILGRTESCLYVSLRLLNDSNLRWYTLCRVPDRKLTNFSGGHLLVPILSRHAPPAHWSSVVAVDSNIYAQGRLKKIKNPELKKTIGPNFLCIYIKKKFWTLILINLVEKKDKKILDPVHEHSPHMGRAGTVYAIGGPINDAPSSSVSVLDCQCDTWHEAPPMRVARNYPTATVLNGKIYVAGGCEECISLDCIEVFDPKTQTWDSVASPGTERCERLVYKSVGIEGKYHLFGGAGHVAYDPKEGRWDSVGMDMDMGRTWVSYCVINNILFYYNNRKFKWYDYKGRFWRKLMGLERLIKFLCYSRVNLAAYGDKMAVLWETSVPSSSKNKMIWCAEITIERHDIYEICGKTQWFDVVLRVPKSHELVHVLAATV